MKKSFNKLVSLFAVMAIVFTVASCGDDDTLPMTPSISNPDTQSVEVGSTIQVQFDVTTAGGFTSSTATAVNGNATISSNMNAGDLSGSITVDFTGSAAGAGAITLSVTDASGQSKEVTVVITVAAEIKTITVSSNITGEVTWETGKTYILAGRITVLDQAILTIEPGTVVKGQAGAGANATALLVARGGKLNAVGTAALPIIFTSIADEITPEDVAAGNLASPNLTEEVAGLWGGVIVLGKAKISASNTSGDVSEVQIEGIPTSDPNGLYGGSDDADNSGTISYVSIRHGGTNIGNGNEINGLTLGGVGNGTTISNIEIVSNQDDGVEFFGGSVNVSNVVVWNINDDGIDTDQSWSGTLTNFVVIAPNTAGAHAFELDGPEGTFKAGHTIKNGTVLASFGSRAAENLIDVDLNSVVTLENIFITGIKAGQDINKTGAEAPEVVYTKIELNVASADLQNYVTGTIPAGITAANTASTGVGADLTKFSWTWASKSTAWGSL
ncbi:hypothetical protein [uncultured Roseivirga sp.]|uniref:hypothetical protein n=1 Tax=uncultured Roseivirga sp. TaxID=543088 RepID=UPI0030DD9077|tara:strand:+ start:10713 stop:12212 length:1500 start_codon:yes stop_codon:yes gene_type:complete